jgi:hypothetical protein
MTAIAQSIGAYRLSGANTSGLRSPVQYAMMTVLVTERTLSAVPYISPSTAPAIRPKAPLGTIERPVPHLHQAASAKRVLTLPFSDRHLSSMVKQA